MRRSRPDSIEAHYNLGYARHELGRFADAIPALETARKLGPKDEQVWYHLFNTRLAAGRGARPRSPTFSEFEEDAALTPCVFHAALDSLRGHRRPRQKEERYLRRATDLKYAQRRTRGRSPEILARLQYFDVYAPELLRLYQTYDALMQQRCAGDTPLANPTRAPGGRVRIGYLSADFRQHVMGRLMFDVISAHDRDRYAILSVLARRRRCSSDP